MAEEQKFAFWRNRLIEALGSGTPGTDEGGCGFPRPISYLSFCKRTNYQLRCRKVSEGFLVSHGKLICLSSYPPKSLEGFKDRIEEICPESSVKI